MKTLSAVMMGLLTFSILASAQAWNHDPASPIGPLHWGKVAAADATCGDSITGEVGMKQSPIDIVPANALMENFSAPLFKYQPTPLKIENTGHYVEVPYDPTSFLYVGSQPTDVYQLVQFHFHAPSEHTINGVRYDAELHLVHTNAIGETAVVGVLPVQFRSGVADIRYHHGQLSPHRLEKLNYMQEVNVFDLLPFRRGFYRYAGSLTTPPCSESVQWFVLQDPVPITPSAVAKLHSVISMFPNYGGYANKQSAHNQSA